MQVLPTPLLQTIGDYCPNNSLKLVCKKFYSIFHEKIAIKSGPHGILKLMQHIVQLETSVPMSLLSGLINSSQIKSLTYNCLDWNDLFSFIKTNNPPLQTLRITNWGALLSQIKDNLPDLRSLHAHLGLEPFTQFPKLEYLTVFDAIPERVDSLSNRTQLKEVTLILHPFMTLDRFNFDKLFSFARVNICIERDLKGTEFLYLKSLDKKKLSQFKNLEIKPGLYGFDLISYSIRFNLSKSFICKLLDSDFEIKILKDFQIVERIREYNDFELNEKAFERFDFFKIKNRQALLLQYSFSPHPINVPQFISSLCFKVSEPKKIFTLLELSFLTLSTDQFLEFLVHFKSTLPAILQFIDIEFLLMVSSKKHKLDLLFKLGLRNDKFYMLLDEIVALKRSDLIRVYQGELKLEQWISLMFVPSFFIDLFKENMGIPRVKDDQGNTLYHAAASHKYSAVILTHLFNRETDPEFPLEPNKMGLIPEKLNQNVQDLFDAFRLKFLHSKKRQKLL